MQRKETKVRGVELATKLNENGDITVLNRLVYIVQLLYPEFHIPQEFYLKYKQAAEDQITNGLNLRKIRVIFRELCDYIGASGNLSERRISTEDAAIRELEAAAQGGRRIIVNTDNTDFVGLVWTGKKWRAVGTGSNISFTSYEVYYNLMFPPVGTFSDNRKKIKGQRPMNIMTFPAVSKKPIAPKSRYAAKLAEHVA